MKMILASSILELLPSHKVHTIRNLVQLQGNVQIQISLNTASQKKSNSIELIEMLLFYRKLIHKPKLKLIQKFQNEDHHYKFKE